jgi:hypothetical protein
MSNVYWRLGISTNQMSALMSTAKRSFKRFCWMTFRRQSDADQTLKNYYGPAEELYLGCYHDVCISLILRRNSTHCCGGNRANTSATMAPPKPTTDEYSVWAMAQVQKVGSRDFRIQVGRQLSVVPSPWSWCWNKIRYRCPSGDWRALVSGSKIRLIMKRLNKCLVEININ